MDNNSLIALILDVLVFLFLLYAIYYILRLVKKKTVAPVTTKPVTQTPTVAAPVQPAPAPKPTPQVPVATAPIQPAVTEGEVKVKQIESQAVKSSVAPTPAPKPTDRGKKIVDIEGIGPVYAAKLNSVNIYTTSDLLKAGGTPLMRRELAEKIGISHNLILRWVNMADLFRIRGVGEEYSDLLEAAGVDTVVELAKRVPEHLHAKMLEVNGEKKLVRRPPGLSMVESWVKEAKTLPRKIEY